MEITSDNRLIRPSGRAQNELRNIEFISNYTKHAEGSCLVKYGDTHVLCTASIEEKVPIFLRNSGKGWVTAEYGMLPRSTHTRSNREASRGKQGGRTLEIQMILKKPSMVFNGFGRANIGFKNGFQWSVWSLVKR